MEDGEAVAGEEEDGEDMEEEDMEEEEEVGEVGEEEVGEEEEEVLHDPLDHALPQDLVALQDDEQGRSLITCINYVHWYT